MTVTCAIIDNEAARWWNTKRPLTRSLDSTEEGLAMKATRVCCQPDCERPPIARMLCGNHYNIARRRQIIDIYPTRSAKVCGASDCTRKHWAGGYCRKHFVRMKKFGSLDLPVNVKPECSVEACAKQSVTRGLCVAHYERKRRYGHAERQPPTPDVEYRAAHQRVQRAKGAADRYACTDCGTPAQDWSYIGNSPNERTSSIRGMKYSTDAGDYVPRCRPCHGAYDAKMRGDK